MCPSLLLERRRQIPALPGQEPIQSLQRRPGRQLRAAGISHTPPGILE
jgi:hypothetical protein